MKIKDSLLVGIPAGLLGPTLGILIFYFANFTDDSLATFIELSVKEKMLSPLLSLCAVINLGIFYLFLQFEYYYSARGVILSTLLYGLVIVVLKFVM
jgi:hypothetical protein